MSPTIAVLIAGLFVSAALDPVSWGALAQKVPAAAQIIDQKAFNVLDFVPPSTEPNDSTVRIRPQSYRGIRNTERNIGIRLAWSHSAVPDCQAIPHLR